MITIFMPWPLKENYFGEYLHFYNEFINHKEIKLVNNFDDADYIIYINDIKNIYNQQHRYKHLDLDLVNKINNYDQYQKEIILDYTDFTTTTFCCPNDLFKKIFLYFKRSVVYKKKMSLIKLKHIIPISYGIRNDYLKYTNNNYNRDIDISCFFTGKERGFRGLVANFLRKSTLNKKYKICVGRVKSKKDVYSNVNINYMKQMQKSKIIVTCNPKYQEGDFRLWEAINSKALVFVDKMITPINNPLIHKKHIIYYTTPQELEKLLKYYLENEKERLEIAQNGYNYCIKYHTFKSRIDYIISNIKLMNKIQFNGDMLIYSICYYYGKNNKVNIDKHIECFNKITENNKIFIINCMVDTDDHNIGLNDINDYMKQFNINFKVITSFNWGGTILGLWDTYNFLKKIININSYHQTYIAHFEEDFRPIKSNFYIASKRRITLFGHRYIYVGETKSGKINSGNHDGRLKGKAYRNATRLGDPEVWTDGGYYFSSLKNLKIIDNKIGIFHKGNNKVKYTRALDGIDIGEVGFPTLLYHNGFKFYPLKRDDYFNHN